MRTRISLLCSALLVGALWGCGQSGKPGEASATTKTPESPSATSPAGDAAKTPEPASASNPAGGTAQTPEPVPATAPAGEGKVLVSFELVHDPQAEDPPYTQVFLTITEGGKPPEKHDLGRFSGCSDTSEMDTRVLAQVTCFWAGAGDQFDLSQDGDSLVVKQSISDEGMEGGPEIKEIFRYKIPEGAAVEVKK